MILPIQPELPDGHATRFAAILLAAGYSSRMGEFKPLLPVGGRTAIQRCIDIFHDAGVIEVIAVLGHRCDELRPIAERSGARCIFNAHFENGMYSSVVTGSRALPASVEAAFVLPVDMPLVRPATVRQLADAWASPHSGIVYPLFEKRRGHPPLISRKILTEVSSDISQGSLSTVLARYENEAIELPVVDQAIHMDMDTRADYDELEALANHRDIPTILECEAILASQSVELSVVAHSYMVAEIACRLAFAISCRGQFQNLDLVRAGALLHDLAKGQPDHAAVGARILRSMGYSRVAEIVAAHTDLNSYGFNIDEKAIVYLADKLVSGDQLVTIAQRFEPAITRFRNNPVALNAARRRLDRANEVACAVEMGLGTSLDDVMDENFGLLTHWSGMPFADEAGKR